ncbi:translation elongation factor Ts [Patescibacteria group bacterium]|nr:translation elongation factor Ts [Patescibacteria group bacterium]MBU1124293.1 translation elongation factor Ts [Patescibacteria group bacterium]MBU1911322.1 translation elongation factor Ts [Patescibacteria group bacterium]
MPDTSASTVASLRSRTGVSILQCKKALDEAGGDEDKAIEILRKSGEAQAVKKSARDQKEGALFLAQEGNKAGIVLLNCETDFVARNPDFQKYGEEFVGILMKEGEEALKAHADSVMSDIVQKLGENISLGEAKIVEAPVLGSYIHNNNKIAVIVGTDNGDSEIAKDIAMHAAAMNPLYVTPEEVSVEDIEKEKAIWKEQLTAEGKPEEIMEKIMIGKEKKFREENALVTQEFVKDPSKKVGDHLGDAKVVEYVRMAVG